ncbi:ABC transporter permease [Parenemella sanctibonifatiensis]|uniref:Polyketide antibiotic transporter n=1 Tax=Parenemella sanctibonifatiensis TaxID=2016505 RepID=A0A255EGY2_9ACTN|nr:polyketide antibiotic transporter [Parenemella sanctibonifatiensis]OYN90490.1 polyketide antibiotic transporter [Parenemella sanctibonifatiensis]
MNTDTTVNDSGGSDTDPNGRSSDFTGTGRLLRLNLRLGRIGLAIWVVAMFVGVWSSVVALAEAYPDQAALDARAALLGNPAAVMMTGPAFAVDDYTLAAATANELSLYVLLAVAIMAILWTVRHTRAEEESGRLEMVRALPVGRYAPAAAAMLSLLVATGLVGAATAGALVAAEMPVVDSLAFGLATMLTGMVFAGLTAVVAQLTESARTVSAASLGLLAAAFLVRGVGDVIEPTGSWLSWFSPLAWAQQTRLYVDLRWWPLLVSAGATLLLFGVAAALTRRRDIGAGLRAARSGPARAGAALRTPAGLAEALMRGSFLAVTVGMAFFAVAMGALANEVDTLLESNPELAQWIALTGGDLTADFAGIILGFTLIAPLVVGVSGVLSLNAEESTGRLEGLLVGGRSRTSVLSGWLLTTVVQVVALTVVCGVGVGIGVSAATGTWSWLGELVVASLVYLPALVAAVGVAAALQGASPRLRVIAWVLVGWTAIVLFLGELLQLPDWLAGISPFWHVPAVPGADVTATPLLVLGGIAVALTAVGLWGFRHRDLG